MTSQAELKIKERRREQGGSHNHSVRVRGYAKSVQQDLGRQKTTLGVDALVGDTEEKKGDEKQGLTANGLISESFWTQREHDTASDDRALITEPRRTTPLGT